MGRYLGDFKNDSIVHFCWDTFDKNGASAERTTSGAIKVYKDNNAAECTAGITDTQNFDGVSGINLCKIDLSSDEFYESGHDYCVVLTAAVIDGETVNAVLAGFSVESRFASSSVIEKAAKTLVNKAVQDKLTGAISYYDDDGESVILTMTPTDDEDSITLTPGQ